MSRLIKNINDKEKLLNITTIDSEGKTIMQKKNAIIKLQLREDIFKVVKACAEVIMNCVSVYMEQKETNQRESFFFLSRSFLRSLPNLSICFLLCF